MLYVFEPTIIVYHMTKVLKTFMFMCAFCYLKVHDSQSSAFAFHISFKD
jgi:hypothetical protein